MDVFCQLHPRVTIQALTRMRNATQVTARQPHGSHEPSGGHGTLSVSTRWCRDPVKIWWFCFPRRPVGCRRWFNMTMSMYSTLHTWGTYLRY